MEIIAFGDRGANCADIIEMILSDGLTGTIGTRNGRPGIVVQGHQDADPAVVFQLIVALSMVTEVAMYT